MIDITRIYSENFSLDDALKEIESLYGKNLANYIDSDTNELIVEIGNNSGFSYSLKDKKWKEVKFLTEEDLDKICAEIEEEKARNYKYKRTCRKDKITIMCDYCADGIWYNGGASYASSKRFPLSVHILERQFQKWQDTYEYLYRDIESNKFKQKVIERSALYQRWLIDGYILAQKVKQRVSNRFIVNYFNEVSLKRINIKKGKLIGKYRNRKKIFNR